MSPLDFHLSSLIGGVGKGTHDKAVETRCTVVVTALLLLEMVRLEDDVQGTEVGIGLCSLLCQPRYV